MVKKKEKKKIRNQKNNETFALERGVSSKNENIWWRTRVVVKTLIPPLVSLLEVDWNNV